MSSRICSLLVITLFMFANGAFAPASAYNPLPVDLILCDGEDKTIGVYILNLTPYTMSFDSTFLNNQMNGVPFMLKDLVQQNRNVSVTGVFAPIGAPAVIPPAAPGRELRPYPMAIGFQDGTGYVNAYSAMWHIHGVQAKNDKNVIVTGNAKLSINFNRPKPSAHPESGLFPLVSAVVKDCIDVVSTIIEPPGPLSWVEPFTGTDELAKRGTSFSQENRGKNGDAMYVSAYVSAADGSGVPVTIPPPGYTPDVNRTIWADDSVIASQEKTNGIIQSSLVVVTQVLRGQKANSGQSNGTVPLMMVTVATYGDWAAANTITALYAKTSRGDIASTSLAVRTLRQILDQRGKQGRRDLALLIRSLKKNHQEILLKAALELHGSHKSTPIERNNQETVLRKLAGALKLHQKNLTILGK